MVLLIHQERNGRIRRNEQEPVRKAGVPIWAQITPPEKLRALLGGEIDTPDRLRLTQRPAAPTSRCKNGVADLLALPLCAPPREAKPVHVPRDPAPCRNDDVGVGTGFREPGGL